MTYLEEMGNEIEEANEFEKLTDDEKYDLIKKMRITMDQVYDFCDRQVFISFHDVFCFLVNWENDFNYFRIFHSKEEIKNYIKQFYKNACEVKLLGGYK